MTTLSLASAGSPYALVALICFAIALAYAVLSPGLPKRVEVRQKSPVLWLVLRWFHSLSWVLLGIAALLFDSRTIVSRSFAALGAIVYIVFLVALTQARKWVDPRS